MKQGRLLLNINNSWTKVCVARNGRLSGFDRIPTQDLSPAFLRKLHDGHADLPLVCASVVPAKLSAVRKLWKPSRLEIVSHRSPLGIRIDYPKPAQIGADRLANAVAATSGGQLPAIVVDFGTAVTFDIVDTPGVYLGGVIAPGLNAMIDYLHERTALLPRLTLREPRRITGKSTVEAMRVGAIVGYRGLVRGILSELKRELAWKKPRIIATGGYSELIARRMPEIHCVDPLFTLQGLRIIAENRWP